MAQLEHWGEYGFSAVSHAIQTKLINYYKINKNVSEMVNNAQELQKFFTDLKTFAQTLNMSEDIGEEERQALGWIRQNLQWKLSSLFTKNPEFSKLFSRFGGVAFEQEIAALRETVQDLTADFNTKEVSTVSSGMLKGSIALNPSNKDELNLPGFAEDVLQTCFDLYKDVLTERNIKHSKIRSVRTFLQQQRQIKADAKQLEYTITTSGNAYLDKITPLLMRSAFSAKNYKELIDSTNWWANIRIGRDVLFNAVLGVLPAIGISGKTTEHFLYSGLWYLKNDSSVTELAESTFAKIRFVYALSGLGQNIDVEQALYKELGLTNASGSVDYIIWNDWANGGIYVKSVAEIVVGVLEGALADKAHYSLFGSITLDYSMFK